MSIDRIVQMKQKPGAIIVGGVNTEASAVFEDICSRLNIFYENRIQFGSHEGKDLLFVSHQFEEGKSKYFCPVYIAEIPDMKILPGIIKKGKQTQKVVTTSEHQTYAIVKIEMLDVKQKQRFVEDWDFPHTPFVETQQVFAVYFNTPDAAKSIREREAFMKYAATVEGIK